MRETVYLSHRNALVMNWADPPTLFVAASPTRLATIDALLLIEREREKQM